jgi:hypothetical protein
MLRPTPYKLKTDDSDLIAYLKNGNEFSYLADKSRNHINKLTDRHLQNQHETLHKLWPRVFVDALRQLKTGDSRESPTNFDSKSFFDEGSLGVVELEKLLESFQSFEGMLYGSAPDRYRDHLAHAFRVWILGHAILKIGLGGKLEIGDQPNGIRKLSPQEWEAMWAIAALSHDIGYPVEAIERITDKSKSALRGLGLLPAGDLRFTFSQQMLPFNDTVIRLMSSRLTVSHQQPLPKDKSPYYTHLQNKYYLKFLKSSDQLKHGIVSALLLSKSLVYFLESDLSTDSIEPFSNDEDAVQFLIRREILRAIASHTCQDIYHLKFNTLPFLLYMTDELQCWGRPTFEKLQRSVLLADADVVLQEYDPENIDVLIEQRNRPWEDSEIRGLNGILDKLHQMLRLAVDTSKLQNSTLRFCVEDQSGNKGCFKLENGRIDLQKLKQSKSKHSS